MEKRNSAAPPSRRRRRRRGPDPAFISGTSSEFLGKKPLPRSVRYRPLVFLLGPPGVGKHRVARHLLGETAAHVQEKPLLVAVSEWVLQRKWPDNLLDAPELILEGPCFLPRRPGVAKALRELLQARAERGLRTVVVESEDQSPIRDLMDAIPPEKRATVVLRFPVGRGRWRFAARVCDSLGLPRHLANEVAELEPWSYTLVEQALERLRDEMEPPQT